MLPAARPLHRRTGSHNGKLLAVGDCNGSVYLWKIAD
jgi:hypothetical protein